MRICCCILIASLLVAAEDGYQSGDGTAGLGVLTGPVPLDVQAANGLAPGEGTMIRRVIPWAPAGEIGLQPGDVIVAVDGVPTDSRRDLRQEVWSNDPGTAFEVTILRDGHQEVLTGTYGRIPDWLEPRLRLPGERWERHAEARQREFLDRVEQALATAEATAAAVTAAAAAAARGLPPLRYGPDDRGNPVLGLVDHGPFRFRYHWEHEAAAPTEVEL